MILVEPTGGDGYSPVLSCDTCPVQLSLNRYAYDLHEGRELDRLLASVAKADGWYIKPNGEWLCDVCAPSAVEQLGELSHDRP